MHTTPAQGQELKLTLPNGHTISYWFVAMADDGRAVCSTKQGGRYTQKLALHLLTPA